MDTKAYGFYRFRSIVAGAGDPGRSLQTLSSVSSVISCSRFPLDQVGTVRRGDGAWDPVPSDRFLGVLCDPGSKLGSEKNRDVGEPSGDRAA